MHKYFIGSYFVTVFCLLAAYLWGEHVLTGSGFACAYVACILAILEISLSFDNAVVNAMKLEKMSPKWQKRFIIWGILIAVFGMRFIFPLSVVAIFAKLNILTVLNMALNDVNQYAHYLELTHSPIVTFGGAFLLMLFLEYFISPKEVCWLKPIETFMQKFSKIKGFSIVITLIIILLLLLKIPNSLKLSVLMSGLSGILVYISIESLSKWLEKRQELRMKTCADAVKCSGIVGFLYLELIDASFSLDGVLGAFALSKDIIIITLGLFIGAMFVRSLTIMLVEKKTLKEFIYLEHGAHWAIGFLAILMFLSTFMEIPEVVTGTIGFIIILSAVISSILENKKGAM